MVSFEQYRALECAHADVELILIDNSTEKEVICSNELFSLDNRLRYICNNGNIGLAQSYNIILDLARSNDWILWADDDTFFSSDYLEKVYDTISSDGNSIIAGIVKTNTNTVLSPIHRKHFKESICVNKVVENVYCINSGLCVNRSIYDIIGYYDERLFVDMIDYWLFDELHKKKMDKVMVLPGEIWQAFSGTSEQPLLSKLRRFRIYSKDFTQYCLIEKKKRTYCIWILSKRLLSIIARTITKGRK